MGHLCKVSQPRHDWLGRHANTSKINFGILELTRATTRFLNSTCGVQLQIISVYRRHVI
jgi:hypothetical protein